MLRHIPRTAHASGAMQWQRDLHSGIDIDTLSEQSGMRIKHGVCRHVYREKHYRLYPRLQVRERSMHTVNGSLRQRSMPGRNGRKMLRYFRS